MAKSEKSVMPFTALQESAYAERTDMAAKHEAVKEAQGLIPEMAAAKKMKADMEATIRAQEIAYRKAMRRIDKDFAEGDILSGAIREIKRSYRPLWAKVLGVLTFAMLAVWVLGLCVRTQSSPIADAQETNQEETRETSIPVEQSATLEESRKVATEYLSVHAPHLMSCIDQLVTESHPRWLEAIAISGQETGYCTTGVAKWNNCGGIRSGRPDRTWRQYATKCDGLEDIAYLIESERYAGLTVDGMNGTYCVDESAGSGNCPDWSENIMATVNEMRGTFDRQ